MSIKYAISTEVNSLPLITKTRNGHEFNPNQDTWHIPDGGRVHAFYFSSLCPKCTSDFIMSLKKVLLWYLGHKSPFHAYNMFAYFKHFYNHSTKDGGVISVIRNHHVLSYRGNLPREKECYLGALSGFLKKWHNLGYTGVSNDASSVLDQLRLKGNEKGWAVLTMDPEDGPFTDLELQSIIQAVNNGFAGGSVSTREFSLVRLLIATGARPVQIADLKVGDFIPGEGDEYAIMMPRAKQRHQRRRTQFKRRELRGGIGPVIAAWVEQVKMAGRRHCHLAPEDLPLFPDWKISLHDADFDYHTNSIAIKKEVELLFSKLEVKSHRTGTFMRVTPMRFRYTLGTRAAMEKHGGLVIAELLDHSDTQNVLVYVQAVPEIIDNLDEAIGKDMAQFADAFAGKYVEENFRMVGDPENLIRYPRHDPMRDGVGRCGGCGNCGAMAPIACYTCPDFVAWVDAPHEELLNDLLRERQRWLAETGDKQIAYANDHVIIAVKQVVDKCKEIKEARR